MAIIREKRKQKFSIIDNKIIEDERLTFKARGLLIYMLSKPDDWKFYPSELAKHSNKDGVKAVNTALQEMEAIGYLTRKQERDKNGHFKSVDYAVHEVPQGIDPHSQKRQAAKRQTGKRQAANGTLPNTDIPNTHDTKYGFKGGGSTAAEHEAVFNLWQKDWGFPNSIATQDLNEWIDQFGTDVVSYVIKYALIKNVTARGADRFLAKVFESYAKKQVKTIEEAKQANKEFDHRAEYNNQYHRRRGGLQVREEVPDWLKHPYKAPKVDENDWPDDSKDVMPRD